MVSFLKCKICNSQAIVVPRELGYPLCKEHFVAYVEKRVVKAIRKHNMFNYNDLIGIAYSGGKDSTVLLHILNKIEKRFPHSDIIALIVDEGIHGYRDSALEVALYNLKKLGVKYQLVTFEELYGATLDEIVSIAAKKFQKRFSACTYCGVLRRYAIEYLAMKTGVDKIATGHNLDDEVETFLLNIIRGDVRRLGRLSPAYPKTIHFVPRVKPLRYLSEENIVLYAHLLDLKYHDVTCPYAQESMRNIVRKFILELQLVDPMIKFKLINKFDEISNCFRTEVEKSFNKCIFCGVYTSSNICRKCQILKDIGLLNIHLEKLGKYLES